MSRYRQVREQVARRAEEVGRAPEEIGIVAVSKGRSLEEIREVYGEGCRDFGENRVQELVEKRGQLPEDIRWHFIGKLQSNKVGKLLGTPSYTKAGVALIHSVDSVALAKKLSASSQERGVSSAILLEVNSFGDEHKGGLAPEVWESLFPSLRLLPFLSIQGLMTMAPHTEEEAPVRRAFACVRELKRRLEAYAPLPLLSMGMSGDYPLAIAEGATLLRIGSAIFSR